MWIVTNYTITDKMIACCRALQRNHQQFIYKHGRWRLVEKVGGPTVRVYRAWSTQLTFTFQCCTLCTLLCWALWLWCTCAVYGVYTTCADVWYVRVYTIILHTCHPTYTTFVTRQPALLPSRGHDYDENSLCIQQRMCMQYITLLYSWWHIWHTNITNVIKGVQKHRCVVWYQRVEHCEYHRLYMYISKMPVYTSTCLCIVCTLYLAM